MYLFSLILTTLLEKYSLATEINDQKYTVTVSDRNSDQQ